MENTPEQKEPSNSQQEPKKIEETPKIEEEKHVSKEIPITTEMCQLIYYDFSVK